MTEEPPIDHSDVLVRRTFYERICAALLIALAVSPFTAPFHVFGSGEQHEVAEIETFSAFRGGIRGNLITAPSFAAGQNVTLETAFRFECRDIRSGTPVASFAMAACTGDYSILTSVLRL